MPASPSVELTDKLQTSLGYSFSDGRLLLEALTHRSYLHENPGEPGGFNERLEFLGDAVLGLVVSEYLFREHPEEDEGVLSRRKATLVQETILAQWALALGIDGALRLGRGEELSGGRQKPSLLANALEAVVAAVFLDGGWTGAREAVLRWCTWLEEEAVQLDSLRDYKTELQEYTQRTWNKVPTYEVTAEEGPEHCKVFTVEVLIGSGPRGTGRGANKKEAAQAAARDALDKLRVR